jgi:hypothetical protein
MAHDIFELLRSALVHYGYWALAAVLLLENTGIPVPGETILLLASFLAYSEHELQLSWIIVVGTLAATVGDNLGYAIGHRGGRPLLERYQRFFRIRAETLARGDQRRDGSGGSLPLRHENCYRSAGRCASHAVAKIFPLQLSGCGVVGFGDFYRGLSFRPALGAPRPRSEALRSCDCSSSRAGRRISLVAQSPPALIWTVEAHVAIRASGSTHPIAAS